MYTSSDGTKKDPKKMNYEYLANAFSKLSREIFNSSGLTDYNQKITNLQIIEREIFNRLDTFLTSKLDDEEWIGQ